MLCKRALLKKTFGWNEFYAMWGINGAKGWAYHAWATENESSIWGTGVVRSGDGYLAQEIVAIKERRKRNGGRNT